MRNAPRRSGRQRHAIAVLATCLAATVGGGARIAGAGEPIPDVDVILEQIPPGLIVQSARGGFDRLVIGGPRAVVEGLAPARLPDGWVLVREGRNAILRTSVSGLAGLDQPVPLRFRLTFTARPSQIDWEIARSGRSLAKARGVVPRSVATSAPRNSLQGVVYLPAEVAPGDTLSFRAVEPLPAGRFVIAGTVVEEFEEEAWAALMRGVNKTRSNIKGRLAAPPADGLLLVPTDGSTCADLAPLAAALAAGALEGAPTRGPIPVARRAAGGVAAASTAPIPVAVRSLGALAAARHDAAKSAIQNIRAIVAPAAGAERSGRAFFAVSPVAAAAAISIKEPGIEDQPPEPCLPPRCRLSADGTCLCGPPRSPNADDVRQPGVAPQTRVFHLDPAQATPGAAAFSVAIVEQGPQEITGHDEADLVALRFETTAVGCRYTPREPTDLDLARAVINTTRAGIKSDNFTPPFRPKPTSSSTAVPGPVASGVVYAVELPADLSPSDPLAIQFVDLFGDLVLDVPRAPVTVRPAPPAGTAPAPCLTAATAFVQDGGAVCACGTFPGPAAAHGLLLDERPLDPSAFLSTSSTTVWFRLPPGTGLGKHFLSGSAEAGFAASCRAITHLVAVAGSIDSSRLLRGETTPMRLRVDGTTEPVPLRLRNLTPAIVAIDGGVEQTIESSGGSPNQVERSVSALTRGDFNVEWTLASPPCPCGGG